MTEETNPDLVDLATELTIAWLGNPNNRASAEEVPEFLRKMHATVRDLTDPGGEEGGAGGQQTSEHVPAVSVRKSLASKDHIISMINGKPYRTLRRHLSTHGLTPEEYRSRYDLKAVYPMVAENYSKQRRDMAKKIGLGQKGRAAQASAAKAGAPASNGRGRGKRARQG